MSIGLDDCKFSHMFAEKLHATWVSVSCMYIYIYACVQLWPNMALTRSLAKQEPSLQDSALVATEDQLGAGALVL